MASMAYPTTTTTHDNQYNGAGYANVSRSLSLIDTVEINRIVKRNGLQYFVLNVYLHHSNQKPILTLISPTEMFFRTRNPLLPPSISSSQKRLGEPDVQVERRFSEFVELRRTLRVIATAAHQHSTTPERKNCVFCRPLLKYLHRDFSYPRMRLQLILPLRTQMEYFSVFVRRLITMVVHVDMDQQSFQEQQAGSCDAAFRAATVLEEFLRKPRKSLCLGII